MPELEDEHSLQVLNQFWAQYHLLHQEVAEAVSSGTNPGTLARLGDDLDRFHGLAEEVSHQ